MKTMACVSRNCDTNAHIKFIFDTAIDDLEWKNPINFGENRKTKMATGGHFEKKKVAYWSEMARNAIENDFRSSKMAAACHFVTKFPHLSPLIPTFPHLFQLFPTFSYFSPLFPTFHHFSPLFTTFSHFLSPAAPKARDGRYCNAPRLSVRLSGGWGRWWYTIVRY